MSEQLDRDLGRVIKDEIGREMQGFEFSAAMKANVMKQIRAGQSGLVVPFERPATRRKFIVPRPLIWTAVAVAAFAFALNLNLGPKDSTMDATMDATQESASLMASPKMAAVPAPSSPEPAPTQEADPTGADSMRALGAAVAQAPTRMIELENVAVGSPVPVAAPRPAAAAPALNLRAAPIGRDLVVLASDGIRRMDASNARVWQNNPGGITPDSILAMNPAGISAVSAGNKVHLISPRGVLEQTLVTSASVTHLAWSAEDRLAVAADTSLTVFRGDQVEYRRDVAPGTRAAFLTDSSLVVFSDQASPKQLAIYDAAGDRTIQVDLPTAGQGLTIMNGGQTILAGGIAVEQSGQVLWQLEYRPEGTTAVPTSELLVAWGGDIVSAVRPDGHEVWRARLAGSEMQRAQISEDGSRVVVVATSEAESGAAIFVLDMAGELVLNERVASVPVDIALDGSKLYLLYGQGHQEFALR